jgi:hypothetical protein
LKTKLHINKFSEQESNLRFEAALRGAFKTPPKPMKDIPRVKSKAKRKPRKRATASA